MEANGDAPDPLPSDASQDETPESVNLRLSGEKLRQELADLRRPYVFRNPQLLTAIITSVGAIIGVWLLIKDDYFKIRDQLNALQAAKTAQVDADARKATEDAARAQRQASTSKREADVAKEAAAKAVAEATRETKDANDLLVSTRARVLDLQAQSASEEFALKAQDFLVHNQFGPAQDNAVAAWERSHTSDARQAILASFSRPLVVIDPGQQVTGFRLSPDGRRIVAGFVNGKTTVLDAATGKELMPLVGHTSVITAVAFSRDSRYIATGSYDNSARIWDAATGRELAILPHSHIVRSVAFSPDGKRVATTGDQDAAMGRSAEDAAIIWDWKAVSATKVASEELNGSIHNALFSPDGSRLLIFRLGATARIVDSATGIAVFRLTGHTGNVNSAIFSPNGLRIVTGGSDNSARVWDAATGKMLVPLAGHTGPVNSAMFSPDGLRVVTASDDGTAGVWDAAAGKKLTELKGHTGEVITATFSSDGKRVLTASLDNTTRVWDAGTGARLATLEPGFNVNGTKRSGYGNVDDHQFAEFLPGDLRVFAVSGYGISIYRVVPLKDVDKIFPK